MLNQATGMGLVGFTGIPWDHHKSLLLDSMKDPWDLKGPKLLNWINIVDYAKLEINTN